ncbi:methyltransferase, partial [Cellulosimicrobium cellulans]|uniref:methyltransferase n=1 Tax=Cellulosimicrobium cellulans TaxID=1710 RepID=UPI000A9986B1
MTSTPGDLPDVLARLGTDDPGPQREDSPVAVDAADRLLLDEAAELLATATPGEVAVVDDRYGALTLGAAALADGAAPDGAGSVVRVHQDACTAEAALDANAVALGLTGAYARRPLGPELLTGARVVLLRLPRGLAALRDVAEHVARAAHPDVVLLAGGRVKHMTPAMNDVLGESFADVRASRGRGKSRVLVARSPRAPEGPPTYPVTAALPDVGLTVVAHGAAFAGPSLDLGTRFLLEQLDHAPTAPGASEGVPAPRDVVDLGCGTGLLAAWAARRWPETHVVAADRSDAAV